MFNLVRYWTGLLCELYVLLLAQSVYLHSVLMNGSVQGIIILILCRESVIGIIVIVQSMDFSVDFWSRAAGLHSGWFWLREFLYCCWLVIHSFIYEFLTGPVDFNLGWFRLREFLLHCPLVFHSPQPSCKVYVRYVWPIVKVHSLWTLIQDSRVFP